MATLSEQSSQVPERLSDAVVGSTAQVMQLLRGELRTPHDLLGIHPVTVDDQPGVVVRARVPRAKQVWVLCRGERISMHRVHDAYYVCFVAGEQTTMPYQLVIETVDDHVRTIDDPYRFSPTLGDVDLHLYGEGRHLRLWEKMGAHPLVIDGVAGTAFAVWAPNARRVSVIGTFNDWDGRTHPMRALGASGVFEVFIPGVSAGMLYKFEIRSPTGDTRIKTDPMSLKIEQSVGHASIVEALGTYEWHDDAWMSRRRSADPVVEPMLIYELHLASWKRASDGRMLTYRELAPLLVQYITELGFTHIELLPVLEHPYGGSWGYQVGGYYAPTTRHGSPDDFRFLVDALHQANIGVLLDWVPAHFPKDDWALRRFDGTACYEHADPRLGDHPEWGTHIFNYARHEVRNFLLANALFWIEEFHLDGLRVDAVASMLYLDYGREAGQWLRNRFGGRENLEAVAFLKQLNHVVATTYPGVAMIAEESTTWPKVTHPIREGGLGFTFKWNMGWMHDTLDYFKVDPFFRKGAHDKLTFAMMYEYSEKFVNPLSHDEVVHMKGSLLRKMPGDEWQRLANLRALIGYSITRPGKSLFFMGTELGPFSEWNHDRSLEWELLADPRRRGLQAFMSAAANLYRAQSCFWRRDHAPGGFSWIEVADREQSVLSYARFDGAAHAVVILNLTPVPRDNYQVGVPMMGTYQVALNSDAREFGGSGYLESTRVEARAEPYHGFPQSVRISLPPLAVLVLLPDPMPRPDEYETADPIDSGEAVVVAVSVVDALPAPAMPGTALTEATPGVRPARRAAGVRRAGVVVPESASKEQTALADDALVPTAGRGASTVEKAKAKAKARAQAKAKAREEEKARVKAEAKAAAAAAKAARAAEKAAQKAAERAAAKAAKDAARAHRRVAAGKPASKRQRASPPDTDA